MNDILIDFNFKLGFRKIWKWKWLICGVCLVAGIIAFIYSRTKPVEYKSVSGFIPPNISTLPSSMMSMGKWTGGYFMAGESDLDRTIDYLTSLPVTDSIATYYDLYDHYGINKEAAGAEKTFLYRFSKSVEIEFHSTSTIRVTVYDTDPQLAADIANRYLDIANNFYESIVNRREGLKAAYDTHSQLLAHKQSIIDSLSYLRSEYGLFNARNVDDEMSRVLAGRLRADKGFAENYDRMVAMELQLASLDERIDDFERDITDRELNFKTFPTYMHVTKYAKPSSFKARPKGSIYVAMAMAATFVIACFVVIVIDRK